QQVHFVVTADGGAGRATADANTDRALSTIFKKALPYGRAADTNGRHMKLNGKSNGNGKSDQLDSIPPVAPASTNGKRTRILIVEDEPAMVAGLRDNFEYEGYEVISAADGAEGLERALAGNPDLVVLDVMMPRMSGLDVCKQLKIQRPSMPIIMLTARGQEIDKVVGLEL